MARLRFADALPAIQALFLTFWLLGPSLIYAALAPPQQLSDYEHRHWGVAHGLPHATVRAIEQTPDGYLWAATEYGLARFNGERFHAFTPRNENALMRPFLTTLALGPNGALWMGSEGGGWIIYETGTFQTIQSSQGLAGLAARGFIPRNLGGFWIVCDRGVNLWTTNGLNTYTIAGLPTNVVIWCLLEDRHQNLWLGTDRGLFGPIHPQSPRVITTPLLTARQVFTMVELTNGQLLAGTDEGLFDIPQSQSRSIANKINALGNKRVRALHADRHGTVWVGTTTGLFRLREGKLIEEEEIHSLRNTSIFDFFEDREDNLWIGAGNGLHCLNERAFTTISARDGLTDEEIMTITQTASNQFLLGSVKGEVFLLENDHLRPLPEYARSSMITAIFLDRKGRWWMGSRRDGLLCDDHGQLTRYGLGHGLLSLNIFAVTQDLQGTLWVGTDKGLNRLEGDGFTPVHLPLTTNQAQPVIRSLFAAEDGSLWIGTQEGLLHLQTNQSPINVRPQKIPTTIVYHITQDKKGHLWLGTSHGIFCLLDGEWRQFKPLSGFPTFHAYWLAHDEQGFTWMSTPWSIFRVETADIFAFWRGKKNIPTPIMFTQSDGLLAMECLGGRQSAGCQTMDGRLIFPTRRGLAIANPINLLHAFRPPRVVIERIRVNGRDYPIMPSLELPPGSRILEIDFAGLSFRNPEKVQHRYKLIGVDDEWNEAYHRHSATYANLSPGRYEFRAIADDGHGAWSAAGAAVELLIKPYFYQTAWFYCGLAAFAGLGIYGGHRWRLRILRKRNQILRNELMQRTRELEKTMAEQLRLEQAALDRKQEQTISQLAAGMAHHLNNQLQAIKTCASILQDESNAPSETLELLSLIHEAVDKSARIVDLILSYGQRHWFDLRYINLHDFLPGFVKRYGSDRVQLRWLGEVPEVTADPDILKRALTTVLNNALEYSPPKTPVIMIVRQVHMPNPDAKSSLPTESPEIIPLVQIQIMDEGAGLSPEVKANLFKPFFTTKDVGQGIGLNLASAYGGFKQMGGWIEADNRPEGGCCFSLYLRLASIFPLRHKPEVEKTSQSHQRQAEST